MCNFDFSLSCAGSINFYSVRTYCLMVAAVCTTQVVHTYLSSCAFPKTLFYKNDVKIRPCYHSIFTRWTFVPGGLCTWSRQKRLYCSAFRFFFSCFVILLNFWVTLKIFGFSSLQNMCFSHSIKIDIVSNPSILLALSSAFILKYIFFFLSLLDNPVSFQ